MIGYWEKYTAFKTNNHDHRQRIQTVHRAAGHRRTGSAQLQRHHPHGPSAGADEQQRAGALLEGSGEWEGDHQWEYGSRGAAAGEYGVLCVAVDKMKTDTMNSPDESHTSLATELPSVKQRAQAGEPSVMARLALAYAYGVGTAEDGKQALDWAHRAAEQNELLGL